ncbi:similar to Saccharomyces cerevisiae YDR270W CCC2 Cu(+2)-transporting P-type ATPase, required for export of copper from the cytosol into an extracytosolic compartment [Maudiozyma saulgeensis]|uniref:Similar to Saccharomyces cerevisiae YDR270W CCC2 Cu(+2)-transporting P-type ATPase, required for export of copper from the cytosol into an extracytosolic compartment n=1 Tax=Maudiozyma saulgeensis TaxID=1789683 RepID=A0A1X7R9G5_9SACH|nr:similar to Saccharomyces cerevisiae YDR270W CCC2 Cu(+2)-transporting P-type ATPase, required for export of copper from the cytosol into an extracytosolic compartment [Kazachstania saulgeensis]
MGEGNIPLREAVVNISGMTCSACVQSIATQLEKMDMVSSVIISLSTCEGKVTYAADEPQGTVIKEEIEDCGFDCVVLRDTLVFTTTTTNVVTEKECTLRIGGMTCSACVNAIKSQLDKLPGVLNVDLSLLTEECVVKFDSQIVSKDDIKNCIEDCGFDANLIDMDECGQLQIVKTKFILYDDNDDYNTIIQKFDHLVTLRESLISIEVTSKITDNRIVTIEYNQSLLGIRDLIELCEQETRYKMVLDSSYDKSVQLNMLQKTQEISIWKTRCMKSCTIAIISMLMYMGIPMLDHKLIMNHTFPYNEVHGITGLYYRDIIGLVMASYVLFHIGIYFYISCWKSLMHGTGTMDTLITISTLSAYLFSLGSIICNIIWKADKLPSVVFDTAIMLIAFISIGKLLENRAKSQTSTALSHLIELSPNMCTLVISDDNTKEIPIELLQLGDIIEVKPGMKIPSDGSIVKGETEIDESLMTGESNLIYKKIGSHVIGGTINGPGHFYFKVTSVGSDTKLSQIISTIKNAQLTKTPIQKYADKLCAIFVPVILSLSVLTFITWYFISKSAMVNSFQTFISGEGSNVFKCLRIATSVVIVACPCALGLATPTAIMVGTGIGAQNGVLIKNGDAIEKCKDIKGFVFDKTGTLTTGMMTVENFNQLNEPKDLSSEELWTLIKVCESKSEHPVARTIVNYASLLLSKYDDNEIGEFGTDNCNIVMGQGLECDFTHQRTNKKYKVCIGFGSTLFPVSIQDEIRKLSQSDLSIETNNDGYTIAYVSINDSLVGNFEIVDRLRDDSYVTIQYLKSMGYKIYIVTGDNHFAASKIASALEIDITNVFSSIPPNGKCEVVKRLQNTSEPGSIIFVGDGINDSPALVTADLGIAVSTGTEIAIDAADIVILAGQSNSECPSTNASLKRLVYAIDISQRTYQRIKLNLFWALSYNTFMVPIAMGILVPWGITLPPMIAGMAMALSSVSVVLSSLQLKDWTPPVLESNQNYNDYKQTGLLPRLHNFLFFWRSNRTYQPLVDDLEMNTNLE